MPQDTTAHAAHDTWIRRCADRIRQRHLVDLPEAMDLATEMHVMVQGRECPERLADALFSGRGVASVAYA